MHDPVTSTRDLHNHFTSKLQDSISVMPSAYRLVLHERITIDKYYDQTIRSILQKYFHTKILTFSSVIGPTDLI